MKGTPAIAALLIVGLLLATGASLTTIGNLTVPPQQSSDAIVTSLKAAVNATMTLFIVWNVPTNDSAWDLLYQVNASISNVQELINQGRIGAAYELAKQLMNQLKEIVEYVLDEYSDFDEEYENVADVLARIKALNETAMDLLVSIDKALETGLIDAETATELKINVSVIVDELLNLSIAVEVAVQNNISIGIIEEKLDEIENKLDEIRELINEEVGKEISEEVKEKINKVLGKLKDVVKEIEEKAEDMREEGLTEFADRLNAVASNINEIIHKIEVNINVTSTTVVTTELLQVLSVYIDLVHTLEEASEIEVETIDELMIVTSNLTEIMSMIEEATGLANNITEMCGNCSEWIVEHARMLNESVSGLWDMIGNVSKSASEFNQTEMEDDVYEIKEEINELISMAQELKMMVQFECNEQGLAAQIVLEIDRLISVLMNISMNVEESPGMVDEIHHHIKVLEKEKLSIVINKTIEAIQKIIVHVEASNCSNSVDIINELEISINLLNEAYISLQASNITEAVTQINQAITHLTNASTLMSDECISIQLEIEITKEILILITINVLNSNS